jgi:small subunit ribosomal protein S2
MAFGTWVASRPHVRRRFEEGAHRRQRRQQAQIPIIAIVDTNADRTITVPIAGNDDAIRSVELITKAIADAVIEARREAPVREETEEGESYTYSSDRGAEPAGEEERKRKRRPRRRRAKPEAIAARLKAPGEGDAPDAGAEGAAEAE